MTTDGKEKENTTQVLEEEDDFVFGNEEEAGSEGGSEEGGSEGGKESKEGESSGEGSGDDTEGEESEKDGAGAEGSERSAEKSEEEGTSGSGEESGEKGESAGKDSESSEDGSEEGEGDEGEGKEGEGSEDFFGSEFEEDKGSSEEETAGLEVQELASTFEIEAESKDEFIEKLSEKIENSKKELKLDGYSADARSVINYLNENDGKLDDFFYNKEIASLQSVIGLGPEEKVLSVRIGELTRTGINAEEASTQAKQELEELSTREIKDRADDIDTQARDLMGQEIKKIVGDREKISAQEKAKAEKRVQREVENLKGYIAKQDNFMGIELSDKAKQNIVREIESGSFDEVANKSPEASKFAAYMINKFGKKILETISNKASEQNRKGHNAAMEKTTSALHKTKGAAQTKKTGKEKQAGGDQKNFDSWADEKLFDEDAE